MSKRVAECGVAVIDNRELNVPWVLWYNIPSDPSLYASGTRNDLHCWERKATKATKATKSATVVTPTLLYLARSCKMPVLPLRLRHLTCIDIMKE